MKIRTPALAGGIYLRIPKPDIRVICEHDQNWPDLRVHRNAQVQLCPDCERQVTARFRT